MANFATPRMLRALKVIKELESKKFSEKDLRGLTKIEKEFIRDNDYNVFLQQKFTISKDDKQMYMFIAKNLLGKKQLFAINKKQSINPNGNDISKSIYNFECWLMFNAINWSFSKFNYSRIGGVPPIEMIFA